MFRPSNWFQWYIEHLDWLRFELAFDARAFVSARWMVQQLPIMHFLWHVSHLTVLPSTTTIPAYCPPSQPHHNLIAHPSQLPTTIQDAHNPLQHLYHTQWSHPPLPSSCVQDTTQEGQHRHQRKDAKASQTQHGGWQSWQRTWGECKPTPSSLSTHPLPGKPATWRQMRTQLQTPRSEYPHPLCSITWHFFIRKPSLRLLRVGCLWPHHCTLTLANSWRLTNQGAPLTTTGQPTARTPAPATRVMARATMRCQFQWLDSVDHSGVHTRLTQFHGRSYIMSILFLLIFPDFLIIFTLLTILKNAHRPCKQYTNIVDNGLHHVSLFFSDLFLIFLLYLH